MKIRRRSLVLASLIIALSTAVYLNWQFSDNKAVLPTNDTPITENDEELGEARYVNATENESIPVKKTSDSSESKQFLSEAIANRQKARNEAIELIKTTLGDTNADEHSKSEAIKQTNDIAANIQRESNIENLIKAKGYGECMALIQNGECNVILSPKSLNDSTAVTVFDIVSGQTGFSSDKIKIIG